MSRPDKRTPLTQADLRARHAASALFVSEHVQIRASTIPAAGGGVFTTVDLPAGTTVGYYGGVSSRLYADQPQTADSRDYRFAPDCRDQYDPGGRLRLNTGELLNVHGWSAREWAELTAAGRYGVAWVAGAAGAGPHPPNWTRFVNHASPPNLSVQATSRGGRSHGLYASRRIAAGEELFISYGAAYWSSRGVVPQRPETAAEE